MIVRDQMDEWYKTKTGIDVTKELVKEIVKRLELPNSPSAEMVARAHCPIDRAGEPFDIAQ